MAIIGNIPYFQTNPYPHLLLHQLTGFFLRVADGRLQDPHRRDDGPAQQLLGYTPVAVGATPDDIGIGHVEEV